jgi:SagB-type dehydrogenase family enzyme
MTEKVGEQFQRETRYTLENIGGHHLDWAGRPDTYKVYPDTPLTALPAPFDGPLPQDPEDSLWHAVLRRRSVRQFTDEPLSLLELSRLLWAGAGVTRVAPNQLYRAAPSAGALYPIETYIAANRVRDLPAGLYHYRVAAVDERGYVDPGGGHALEQLGDQGIGRELAQAALAQGLVARAAAVFVWTAVFPRSRWKYRERAFRYVYLDAGHVAAQISLAAVALGLGTCQIGAFFDEVVDDLLGVDGESEATLYLTAVGHPGRGEAGD